MKKKTRWIRREIVERFMTEEELEEFLTNYENAKLVNRGRKGIRGTS
jgi:hypothetical protein